VKEAIGHVVLTVEIHQEDGYFVAKCLELGVPSFGDSLDEALHNVMDATTLYLNTLEEDGDRERILGERGIKIIPGLAGPADEVGIKVRPGKIVSPMTLPVPALAAVG
jgi:predicted RNase H-like HicB family nuclease